MSSDGVMTAPRHGRVTEELPQPGAATNDGGAAGERVRLAHGGGGELMNRLIRDHIVPRFSNAALAPLSDGAVLAWSAGRLVFTTDSYVVTPVEFPGGDIGRLAVCGTVNDLAVMGATPEALSLGLILEEGLPMSVLDRILASAAAAADAAGVRVVTGDTKVIERRGGDGDGVMINTAGVGRMRPGVELGLERVRVGDAVVLSGPIGEHALAILSAREGIEFESRLKSDAAPLTELAGALLASGAAVRFMRDPTRGGLAGVLADLCEHSGLSVEIDEARVPVRRATAHAAAMLGLDPLTLANEGKLVCVVARDDAERALSALRGHALGRGAAIIGRLTAATPPLVELCTVAGGRRIVQRPYGEEQPRIC